MRRRIGSLSLILILILTPLVMILMTLFQGARIQAEALDVERALSAQVKARLAGFSKPLYQEFGLLALTDQPSADPFERLLPQSLAGLKVQQTADQPLKDPTVLKSSIQTYMRLRLPASLLKTIAEQTGIRGSMIRTGPHLQFSPTHRLTYLSNHASDDFSNQVGSAVQTLLSDQIQKSLDDDMKAGLSHYRHYVAECVSSGSEDQNLLDVPDIFNPAEISQFAQTFSEVLTVPSHDLFEALAVREYVLSMFWSAGQPSQAIQARSPGISLSGDHLVHRNLSGLPLKQFKGREPGETEQILTGGKTSKAAIAQVKTLLVLYRSALYLFRQLSKADGLTRYRVAAGGVATVIAVASSGTIIIDPEIIAYLLLTCDALREGFSDYGRLMKGQRLPLLSVRGSDSLALDYPMHLRILSLMASEKTLLKRISEQLSKRHGTTLNTRIQVTCTYRGLVRSQQGSLLTLKEPT